MKLDLKMLLIYRKRMRTWNVNGGQNRIKMYFTWKEDTLFKY